MVDNTFRHFVHWYFLLELESRLAFVSIIVEGMAVPGEQRGFCPSVGFARVWVFPEQRLGDIPQRVRFT